MTRRRLSLLLLAVAVGAAAWAGLGRSDADRLHETVFGLALADRYPLVTRSVSDLEVTYLFWSPDDVTATCTSLASDPDGWRPTDSCTFVALPDGRVKVTATAVPDGRRGGSLVRVTARVRS